MKTSDIFKTIKEEFYKTIDEKNSWGKNEAKRAFDSAVDRTMFKLIDVMEEKEKTNG